MQNRPRTHTLSEKRAAYILVLPRLRPLCAAPQASVTSSTYGVVPQIGFSRKSKAIISIVIIRIRIITLERYYPHRNVSYHEARRPAVADTVYTDSK